jgi:hypothetical protein
MQLSRSGLNDAFARIARLQTWDNLGRNLPETLRRRPSAVSFNRAVTAIIGLLAFLVVVFLLFAAAATFGQAKARASAEAALGSNAVLTEAAKPFDAEAGYVSAYSAAHTWAEDATLVQAQVTLTADQQQFADAPWSFVFYSAQRRATSLFVAAPGRTVLLSTRPSSGPVSPVELAEWQMDSSEALRQFLARGGALFLEAYPQATLTLALSAAGRATWQGRLVDNDSGNTLHLNFDAATGALVVEPVR